MVFGGFCNLESKAQELRGLNLYHPMKTPFTRLKWKELQGHLPGPCIQDLMLFGDIQDCLKKAADKELKKKTTA